MVRDAFDTSVACTAPPVSFHTSHVSTVPNASPSAEPVSRRIHSSLVAEKYGSAVRPVRVRIVSAGSARQRSAVRRSCQTTAGYTGSPLRRSQTTVVSRWLVIPSAAIAPAGTPASASAASAARSTLAHSSLGSCSTHPGRGVVRPTAA